MLFFAKFFEMISPCQLIPSAIKMAAINGVFHFRLNHEYLVIRFRWINFSPRKKVHKVYC